MKVVRLALSCLAALGAFVPTSNSAPVIIPMKTVETKKMIRLVDTGNGHGQIICLENSKEAFRVSCSMSLSGNEFKESDHRVSLRSGGWVYLKDTRYRVSSMISINGRPGTRMIGIYPLPTQLATNRALIAHLSRRCTVVVKASDMPKLFTWADEGTQISVENGRVV